MIEIKNYHVLVYGSQAGYQTNRAQIALYGSDTRKPAAYIRFNDPGMYFEPERILKNFQPPRHFGLAILVDALVPADGQVVGKSLKIQRRSTTHTHRVTELV